MGGTRLEVKAGELSVVNGVRPLQQAGAGIAASRPFLHDG
jgi:hypothetical protein